MNESRYIKGIKVNSIDLDRDNNGNIEIQKARYAIISRTDKVIAKQSVTKYTTQDDMKVDPSQKTLEALNTFVNSFQADIEELTGLAGE